MGCVEFLRANISLIRTTVNIDPKQKTRNLSKPIEYQLLSAALNFYIDQRFVVL